MKDTWTAKAVHLSWHNHQRWLWKDTEMLEHLLSKHNHLWWLWKDTWTAKAVFLARFSILRYKKRLYVFAELFSPFLARFF